VKIHGEKLGQGQFARGDESLLTGKPTIEIEFPESCRRSMTAFAQESNEN